MTDDDVTAMFRPKLDVVSLLHQAFAASPGAPVRAVLVDLRSDRLALAGPLRGDDHLPGHLRLARRAAGLPATAINWGLWKSLSDSQSDERASGDSGLRLEPMADEVAIQALPLLTGPGAPVALRPSSPPTGAVLATAYRTRAALRIVDDLLPTDADARQLDRRAAPSSGMRCASAEPTRRRGILVDHVTAQVAAAMGLASPQLLDPSAGFFQSGMDSLMSVTLQRALSDSLGEALPASVVFDYPTVEALAGLSGHHSSGAGRGCRGQKSVDDYEDLSDDELLNSCPKGWVELDGCCTAGSSGDHHRGVAQDR